MHNKDNLIVFLIVIFVWTTFIFSDAIFYNKQNTNFETIEQNIWVANVANTGQYLENTKQIHGSAKTYEAQIEQIKPQNELQELSKTVSENISNGLESAKIKFSEISKIIHSSEKLEKIYKKENNPDILKALLNSLLSEYDFKKAKEYISGINIFEDKHIDAKTYIYTYINSFSTIDEDAMTKFMAFIDQMRYKSLISSDDYLFYQGLSKLWSKDYDGAKILFTQIQGSIYDDFISQINKSIETFENQRDVPESYKDSLIALAAMKNGYFTLSQKLALGAILENNEYLLPNQILAYSNFLINDWEKAIKNFYNLIEIDSEYQDRYNFYIGISYYRLGEYDKSISIISQVLNNLEYKTDVYRYLLLNYEAIGNKDKMIQVWQKLLGQDDLQASDFQKFYDVVFYKPFAEDQKYNIYNKYSQLSYDFVSMCYDYLGQENDTCLYGEIGLDIVNENRQYVQKGLLHLSENYPQAHIFQALGDYYKLQGSTDEAKTYYLRAASMTENTSQKSIIEQKLISDF